MRLRHVYFHHTLPNHVVICTCVLNRHFWCKNLSAWLRFLCGDSPCKVTWCMQFQSYLKIWRGQCWHQTYLTFWCGESSSILQTIPEKLIVIKAWSLASLKVHDADNFWCITIFTSWYHLLLSHHDLVGKVKKLRQRSTSNLSEILMWRTSFSRYNMVNAIPEELLHSQDHLT